VVKRKTLSAACARAQAGAPWKAARPEWGLQLGPTVNRLSDLRQGSDTLVPVDPERHALEQRIELAKARIAEDLDRASGLVRGVVSRAGRGLGLLGLCAAGLVVAGLVTVGLRRRRRRIRVSWR